MAAAKTKAAAPKKTGARKLAAPKALTAPAPTPAILKAFHHGVEDTENFGFSRFWWEGEGTREGIKAKVLKKLQPKPGPTQDPYAITAARAEPLLPLDAQADYIELRHLLERYDATMPMDETHAFVQVTLHFPEARNMHGPFEEARAFAMEYFVWGRRLAVILVLHAPGLAASASHLHAHLLIPLRRLGPLGWGEVERHLPNDRGRAEVHVAWLAFRAAWEARTRSP